MVGDIEFLIKEILRRNDVLRSSKISYPLHLTQIFQIDFIKSIEKTGEIQNFKL